MNIRRDPANWSLAPFGKAFVVIQLRDKAAGHICAKDLLQAKFGYLQARLCLPPGLTSDVHTLKAFWCERLTIAAARRRIACVP
jgi:hypothetical protein